MMVITTTDNLGAAIANHAVGGCRVVDTGNLRSFPINQLPNIPAAATAVLIALRLDPQVK